MNRLVLEKAVAGLRRRPRQTGCTRATKRCDFWNWGVDHLRPDCCTEHLTEMAFFVDELLTRHGIEHWVDYGTLLGAVREGELIPWDEDVDFGIRARDREAVHALVPEIEAAGYHVDTGRKWGISILYSAINVQAVDLFVWYESDGVLSTTFDPQLDWPGMHKRTSFSEDFLRDPEQVLLYGRPLPAPSPVHRFLADHRYGPDYMTPVRPVQTGALYPNMGPDDMTPAAKRLIERLAERERRLAELTTGSRLSQFSFWRDWVEAGLPQTAPPEIRAEVASEVGPDEWSGPVEQLVASNARLDAAIAELSSRSPRAWARRNARRVSRSR